MAKLATSLVLALVTCACHGSVGPAPPPAVSSVPPAPTTSSLPPVAGDSLCHQLVPTSTPRPRGEPSTVVIVVDVSGSMQGRLPDLQQAIRIALAELSARDEVAIVAFSSDAQLVVDLTPGDQIVPIMAKVDALRPEGGTQYTPALEQSLALLLRGHGPRRHVLFLSDGDAPRDGLDEVTTRLRAAGASITTVAIGDADRELLGRMAAAPGRCYESEGADLGLVLADDLSRATAAP